MPKNSTHAAALNRLAAACRDEVIPLDTAARILGSGKRKAYLVHQSRRRAIFQGELGTGIVAFGGVPSKNPSYGARLSSSLRRIRELLTGEHVGDAYAACARATGKTAHAYSTVLRLKLPDDTRADLERQYAEIERDHHELRRLGSGANPKPEQPEST